MIVGLAGQMRSGKDTLAKVLVERGYVQRAFADPIKKTCGELFGFTHEQLHGDLKDTVDARYGKSPRFIMQRFGTDFVRNTVGPDFWVGKFREVATEENIVVSDVRFRNEADTIRSMGGVVIEVRRARGPRVEDAHAHESERIEFEADAVIENDGSLVDLYVRFGEVLSSLMFKLKNEDV